MENCVDYHVNPDARSRMVQHEKFTFVIRAVHPGGQIMLKLFVIVVFKVKGVFLSFETFSSDSNTSQCSPGYESVFGSCAACEPGTYRSYNQSIKCEPCPRGKFQSGYGATKCRSCPRGSSTKGLLGAKNLASCYRS